MSGSPRITLDRRIPFVAAVFESIEHGADKRRAVRILQEAERKHRLTVLYSSEYGGPPGGASWIRDPGSPPSVPELLRLIEPDPGTSHSSAFEERYDPEKDDPRMYDDLVNTRLYPFLSETCLILEGLDFSNPFFLFFPEGNVICWGGRDWGAEVACWANRNDWNRPVSEFGNVEDWNYAECAFHLSREIQDYDRWRIAVQEILKLSTEEHVRAASPGGSGEGRS